MRLAPVCIVAGLVGLLAASSPATGDETTRCPESQPRPTIAIVEPRAPGSLYATHLLEARVEPPDSSSSAHARSWAAPAARVLSDDESTTRRTLVAETPGPLTVTAVVVIRDRARLPASDDYSCTTTVATTVELLPPNPSRVAGLHRPRPGFVPGRRLSGPTLVPAHGGAGRHRARPVSLHRQGASHHTAQAARPGSQGRVASTTQCGTSRRTWTNPTGASCSVRPTRVRASRRASRCRRDRPARPPQGHGSHPDRNRPDRPRTLCVQAHALRRGRRGPPVRPPRRAAAGGGALRPAGRVVHALPVQEGQHQAQFAMNLARSVIVAGTCIAGLGAAPPALATVYYAAPAAPR